MSKRTVPYGYKLDSLGRQIEDPETKPFLEELLEEAAKGYTSASHLAGMMESIGAPTQRGGKWRPSTIKSILEANEEGINRHRLRLVTEEQNKPAPKNVFPRFGEFGVEMEHVYQNDNGKTVRKTRMFDINHIDFELRRLNGKAQKFFEDSAKFKLTHTRCLEVLGFDWYEMGYFREALAKIENEDVRRSVEEAVDHRLLDLGTLARMCLIALEEKEEADNQRHESERHRRLWEERALLAESLLADKDAKLKRRRA